VTREPCWRCSFCPSQHAGFRIKRVIRRDALHVGNQVQAHQETVPEQQRPLGRLGIHRVPQRRAGIKQSECRACLANGTPWKRRQALPETTPAQRALDGVVTPSHGRGKATRRAGELVSWSAGQPPAPVRSGALRHTGEKEPFHVGWQLSRKHPHAAKLRSARACSPVSVVDGDERQMPHGLAPYPCCCRTKSIISEDVLPAML
jgi:hypothetical protein